MNGQAGIFNTEFAKIDSALQAVAAAKVPPQTSSYTPETIEIDLTAAKVESVKLPGLETAQETWTYSQSGATLTAPDGTVYQDTDPNYTVYSGKGPGLNNPELQHIPNVGPLPRGKWLLDFEDDVEGLGSYQIRLKFIGIAGLPLTRQVDTFLIHGESLPPVLPHFSSEGCLILSPEAARKTIVDHHLQKVLNVIW
jgi:hypothetical protein